MTWDEALEIVVVRTAHERFRELCTEDNPDVEQRDAYRALMLTLAGQPPPLNADSESAQLRAYVAEHGCGPCH